MKPILFVLAFLSLPILLNGQAVSTTIKWDTLSRLTNHAQTHEVRERIDVGEYRYYTDGDSTVYFYSGKRGGDPDHTLKFDSCAIYLYDTAANIFKSFSEKFIKQTFDENDSIIEINKNETWRDLFRYSKGKLVQWTNQVKKSGMWQNYSDEKTWSYDAAGNLVREAKRYCSADTCIDNSITTYTYDNNHYLQTTYHSERAGNGIIYDMWRSEYSYSNDHHQTFGRIDEMDTVTGQWKRIVCKDRFSTQDNQDSISRIYYWDSSINDCGWPRWDTVYIHNDRSQLDSIISHRISSQGADTEVILQHAFTYDADGRITMDLYGSGWHYLYLDYDRSKPRTVVWQGYAVSDTTHYTYNKYLQTLVSNGSQSHRYYYETYAVIADTVYDTTSFNVKVYPVPSTGNVTINITWDEPEPFSCTVSAADGRSILKLSEDKTQNYIKTISLPSSGCYFLKIQSAKKTMVKRIVISG